MATDRTSSPPLPVRAALIVGSALLFAGCAPAPRPVGLGEPCDPELDAGYECVGELALLCERDAGTWAEAAECTCYGEAVSCMVPGFVGITRARA